jgi:hypothetical protein
MVVYDNNNIVQDDGTNQMIQDLFSHLDEDHGDNSDGIYDEPLLEKANILIFKRVKRKSSLHYIVAGELKGYKSFFEHLYDTDPEVCNMFHHIYIKVDSPPFF